MPSSLLRLSTIKFPLPLHRAKTLISPLRPSTFPFFYRRTITSQKIPTESPSSLGSTSESVQNPIQSSNTDNSFEGSRIVMNSGDKNGSDTSRSESRAIRIRAKLQKELDLVELAIEDVSYQHAGHASMRGRTGGETHFNLKIVSKGFEGMNLVKRHRLIYDLLKEELESGLHALSIVAKTPSELIR